MNQDSASVIAIEAIVFIVTDETLCSRFMTLTGSDEDAIRAGINDTDFQAAALDFLLANEPDLITFCEANHIDPTAPLTAKHVLAGPNSWQSI